MSLLLQIGLGLIVAGGIGWGVWNHKHHEDMIEQHPQVQQADMSADVHLTAGSTNADLDTDLHAIDGQLNAVSQTSAGIDESMNTQ